METSKKYPKINYRKLSFKESRYHRGKKCWYASTLLRAAQDEELEPFEYPVACYDLSNRYFALDNMDDFIYQMKRTLETDYENHPIILDDLGQVADGNHRLCHAILDGKTHIMAYRLTNMPEPDFTEEGKD